MRDNDETERREVRQMIDRLEAAWNANDYEAIKALWDRDDPAPIYQAEEEMHAAIDWPMVDDYFVRTAKINQAVRLTFSDVHIKFTGGQDAVVLYQLHWEIKLSMYPKALGGDNRVLTMLRKVNDAWKFHTYIEAPLSPIAYVRTLYESQVRSGV